MNKVFCWFTKITAWLPYFFYARPKYYYEDKKAQSRKIKGGAIVMPNHHSIWDFAAMMFAFPSRNLRCMVSEIMFGKGKAMRSMLNGWGAIRVNRDDHDFSFLEKSCEILDKGGVVEIYPEARLPREGELPPLPFKTSIGYLALHSDAPIIPVAHNGSYAKKERLRVLIGKPVYARAFINPDLSEKENILLVTEGLRNKIIELNDELQRRTKAKEKKKK